MADPIPDLSHLTHLASRWRPLVAALVAALLPAPALAQKASSSDEGCLGCHAGLAQRSAEHRSYSTGGCSSCHQPDRGAEGPCKGAAKHWTTVVGDGKACLSCHASAQSAGGGERTVHSAVRLGQCLGCHSPHRPKGETLLAKGAALCLRCHGVNSKPKLKLAVDPQAKGTHAPVEGGDCQDCHFQTHSSASPMHLTEPVPGLCMGCHDKKLQETRHPPEAKGECLSCHDAHGSSHPKLLKEEGDALCLRCHAQPGKVPARAVIDLKKPAVHAAIESGGCATCHQPPHAGTAVKLLLKPASQLCFDCHDKPTEATHAAVRQGKCFVCHDPHSGEGPLLRQAKLSCVRCHSPESLVPRKVRHAPVTEGRCTSCHFGHKSKEKALLVEAPGALCLKCHDKKSPESPAAAAVGGPFRLDLAKANVHPALDGGCDACHVTTHSGDQKRLLTKAPPELCYDCHDRKDATPFVHTAVKQGQCTVCHDPHTADQPALARDSGAALCFRCHADDLTGRNSTHAPAAQGKCLACHDPHGSANKGNLRQGSGDAVCLSCHAQAVDAGKNKHPAVEIKGCTGCHDPHGAGGATLLSTTVPKLCGECHDQQDGLHVSTIGGGHRISGVPDPRRPGKELSCASCHNPHSSDSPKLFRFGADTMESCDGCHGDTTGKHPELKDLVHKNRER